MFSLSAVLNNMFMLLPVSQIKQMRMRLQEYSQEPCHMCASVCMTVFPQLHNYIQPLCNNYIQCYGSATLHSVPRTACSNTIHDGRMVCWASWYSILKASHTITYATEKNGRIQHCCKVFKQGSKPNKHAQEM